MQNVVTPEVTGQRIGMVQVYRVVRAPNQPVEVVSVVDVASPSMPQGWARGSADRLAARAALASEAAPSDRGADGRRRPAARRDRRCAMRRARSPASWWRASTCPASLAERARRMSKAYEDYTQLRVLKQPLAGVYVSFFVMVTLLILVGSTWMGLYLAKRITRPVLMLSEAAKEIGAGHYDHRIEHEGTDEFGSMVEAFNAMAAEVSQSRRRLERASIDLERKHEEGEGRRRYIEAILERIATGVVSIDRGGRIGTINPSALRLLEVTDDVVGSAAVDVFARPDLAPVNDVLDQAARAKMDSFAQEVALVRDGRERHVVAAATRIAGTDGSFDGTVLVVDDVTPLIRAQKVAAWREVARRLAHEIKNPLTPIQLSAERLRRKLSDVAPPLQDLVQECTSTIIGEVESLKGLVDEFSQFARMPAPRAVPTELHAFLNDTLALYDGLFASVEFQKHYDPAVTQVRRRSRADEARDDQPDRQRHRGDGPAGHDRDRDGARRLQQPGPHRRGRHRPGHSRRRARQAVPAVLLDQGPRQRPRPRHRAAHRRRARRQHRRHRQRADRHPVYHRVACLMASILVVDDEPGVRSSISGVLQDEGFDVDTAEHRAKSASRRPTARPTT